MSTRVKTDYGEEITVERLANGDVEVLVTPTDSVVGSLATLRPSQAERLGELLRAGAARTGTELIAAERDRQVREEGWTFDHDDDHREGEMARAAACYALGRADVTISGVYLWPWENRWWKPAPRVRELFKAGALIAAEIDRLSRAGNSQPGSGA